jgi:hypothetical protein
MTEDRFQKRALPNGAIALAWSWIGGALLQAMPYPKLKLETERSPQPCVKRQPLTCLHVIRLKNGNQKIENLTFNGPTCPNESP